MRGPLAHLAALVLLAGGVIGLTACGDDATTAQAPVSEERSGAIRDEAATRPPFRLTRVAGGLRDALYVTGAPGQASRLYVVRQSGTIRIMQRGRMLRAPFLNVARQIRSGGEQGLLGLAFHPDYARNGRFYVNFTDTSGDTRVVEYRRARANRARATSARTLLRIPQPFANHNGGHIAFGPDGLLYIATGDGGSAGDPEGNGQDTSSLLGKILRIDVDRREGGRQYGIPSGNPFATTGGRPEIFAYGLRNPWRFSFDRTRGDLWIGDVGQNRVEEIDFLRKGHRGGDQLRLERLRGPLGLRRTHGGPRSRPGPPGRAVLARTRLLGDRRVRLPRHAGPGPQGPLRLRRLLHRRAVDDARGPPSRRPPPRHRPPERRSSKRDLVRRGERGGPVCHLGRDALPLQPLRAARRTPPSARPRAGAWCT